jgi:dUTP pyrophosphatase
MNPVIKFAKTRDDAIIPSYAHIDDSGFDFICLDAGSVYYGATTLMSTGLKIQMPVLSCVVGIGDPMPYQVVMELQVRSKSGLTARHGVTVANGVGTIDFGYRGEILIALTKLTPGLYRFEPGMKMAQGVFAPVFSKRCLSIIEIDESELNMTLRGEGGFGSSGK